MENLRNIAIIAHVDHGKTTLVDQLLQQSGVYHENQEVVERVMDSGDLERERGITILAKNTSVRYKGTKINIVDTPGHADFGGEVERVLKMVNGVILLVDAAEGPMPQTRFVLSKALELGHRVIVVLNKIDRPDQRIHEVIDEVLELLMDLNATDEQLDSPMLFCSGRQGTASYSPDVPGKDLQPLFDTILDYIPAPEIHLDEPFQMLVSSVDYNEFVGRIAIGRVERGQIKQNQEIVVCNYHDESGSTKKAKAVSMYEYEGLARVPITVGSAGDIIAMSGIGDAAEHQQGGTGWRTGDPANRFGGNGMNRKGHFLTLGDWSGEELQELLNMADQLKYEQKHGIAHPRLRGKTLGMLFQQPSTRTRVSFETGMYQLGGQALFLSQRDLQWELGETLQDTTRTLSGYLDGMMIRTDSQEEAELLAGAAAVPVLSGRTDYAHPCQVLADLMTIREYKRTFKGKKVSYIGPGGPVANSLIVGALKVGMEVAVACPDGAAPTEEIVKWAAQTGHFSMTEDPFQAVEGADVVYSGGWNLKNEKNFSESEKKVFAKYQVNGILVRNAKSDAIVLHCLPARRGQEITGELLEQHAGEIFTQSENRLHGQKAVLVRLLGGE